MLLAEQPSRKKGKIAPFPRQETHGSPLLLKECSTTGSAIGKGAKSSYRKAAGTEFTKERSKGPALRMGDRGPKNRIAGERIGRVPDFTGGE